jgi:hypothetical protein
MEKAILLKFLNLLLILLSIPALCLAMVSGGGAGDTKSNGIAKVIGDIGEIIRNIAVAGAVLLIVIGGFQWMVSAGDPSKISGAKDKIYSAIFGLLIIILAEVITHLLGGSK